MATEAGVQLDMRCVDVTSLDSNPHEGEGGGTGGVPNPLHPGAEGTYCDAEGAYGGDAGFSEGEGAAAGAPVDSEPAERLPSDHHLVSLHACGSLSGLAARTAVRDRLTSATITMCCYHKLTGTEVLAMPVGTLCGENRWKALR